MTFISGEQLWSFDPATHQERLIGPQPAEPDEPPPPANGCDTFAKVGAWKPAAKQKTCSCLAKARRSGTFTSSEMTA
jgi:hypothetical protein